MPIIAVGMAVVADVAVGIGAVTSTLGIVAAVGATVAAVGAVTGNKALEYVGAGLGLVGGIGALASGAGVFGDAASLTADAATSTAADAASTATSSDVINSFTGAADIPAQSSAMNSLTGAADLAGSPTAAFGSTFDAATAATGGFNGAPPNSDVTAGASTASQDVAGSATATGPIGQGSALTSTDATGINQNFPPNAILDQGANAGDLPTPPIPPGGLGSYDPATGQTITTGINPVNGQLEGIPGDTSSSGILGSIGSFVEKHPTLAFGMLQAGGQFISGMTSTLTPAQVSALNAQAASNQAAANLTKLQTSNIASPRSIATLAPVTGKPGQPIIAQPSAGLINSAPQVNITGVPA
jgi:hypothetical protein